MPMTQQEILGVLADIVVEIAGVPPEAITLHSSFLDDLDIDSLAMVEVGLAVEDALGIVIPDDDLGSLNTVEDVVDRVQRLQSSVPVPIGGTPE